MCNCERLVSRPWSHFISRLSIIVRVRWTKSRIGLLLTVTVSTICAVVIKTVYCSNPIDQMKMLLRMLAWIYTTWAFNSEFIYLSCMHKRHTKWPKNTTESKLSLFWLEIAFFLSSTHSSHLPPPPSPPKPCLLHRLIYLCRTGKNAVIARDIHWYLRMKSSLTYFCQLSCFIFHLLPGFLGHIEFVYFAVSRRWANFSCFKTNWGRKKTVKKCN